MIRPFASGSLEWSWDVAQVDLFRVSSSFVCHTFTLFPQIQILHQATRLLQWGNGPRHSVLSTAEAYWMDFILPRHRACCKLPCGGRGSLVALSLSLRGGTLGEMASAVLSFTHRYDRTEAQGRLSRQVRNYKPAQQRLSGHQAFPFSFILFLLISLSLYCFPEKKTNPIWWFWGRAVRKWESWGECFPLQPILEKRERNSWEAGWVVEALRGNEKLKWGLWSCFKNRNSRWELARIWDNWYDRALSQVSSKSSVAKRFSARTLCQRYSKC